MAGLPRAGWKQAAPRQGWAFPAPSADFTAEQLRAGLDRQLRHSEATKAHARPSFAERRWVMVHTAAAAVQGVPAAGAAAAAAEAQPGRGGEQRLLGCRLMRSSCILPSPAPHQNMLVQARGVYEIAGTHSCCRAMEKAEREAEADRKRRQKEARQFITPWLVRGAAGRGAAAARVASPTSSCAVRCSALLPPHVQRCVGGC